MVSLPSSVSLHFSAILPHHCGFPQKRPFARQHAVFTSSPINPCTILSQNPSNFSWQRFPSKEAVANPTECPVKRASSPFFSQFAPLSGHTTILYHIPSRGVRLPGGTTIPLYSLFPIGHCGRVKMRAIPTTNTCYARLFLSIFVLLNTRSLLAGPVGIKDAGCFLWPFRSGPCAATIWPVRRSSPIRQ